MKAVSTKIDGMSGDFNTAKAADSTPGLCTRPTFFMPLNTFSAASMLASRLAVWERSSNTDANKLSLSSKLTPPTRSAVFSRSASQRACSLLAPRRDST